MSEKFGLKSKIWLKMSIFQIYDFRQIVINGLKPISSGSKLNPYLSAKLNEVKLWHFLYSSAFFENWFLKIPKFTKHLMERRPAEPFMLIDLKKTRHCPLEEGLSFHKNKNKISKNFKKMSNPILENGCFGQFWVALPQKICKKLKKRRS